MGASVFVSVTLSLAGGYYVWKKQQPRELPPLDTKLPQFEQPPSGLPRAPTNEAFGLAIGATDIDTLMRALGQRGLTCEDTSVRAGVQRLREQKQSELAKADDPDAVSGASIVWRRSKKETNPQVRISCAKAAVIDLDPTRLPGPAGRALFVFDSPEHPLRHVSLRRNHVPRDRALADLRETIERYRAIYGEPSSQKGTVPDIDAPIPERLAPVKLEWRYADLLVGITLNDFGKTVSVDEKIEVPWPIQADAPARPKS